MNNGSCCWLKGELLVASSPSFFFSFFLSFFLSLSLFFFLSLFSRTCFGVQLVLLFWVHLCPIHDINSLLFFASGGRPDGRGCAVLCSPVGCGAAPLRGVGEENSAWVGEVGLGAGIVAPVVVEWGICLSKLVVLESKQFREGEGYRRDQVCSSKISWPLHLGAEPLFKY